MEEIKYQESNVKAREVQVGLAKGCISNLNVGGKSEVQVQKRRKWKRQRPIKCMTMEKKVANFEWKKKIEVQCRSYSAELFKVKTTYYKTTALREPAADQDRSGES